MSPLFLPVKVKTTLKTQSNFVLSFNPNVNCIELFIDKFPHMLKGKVHVFLWRNLRNKNLIKTLNKSIKYMWYEEILSNFYFSYDFVNYQTFMTDKKKKKMFPKYMFRRDKSTCNASAKWLFFSWFIWRKKHVSVFCMFLNHATAVCLNLFQICIGNELTTNIWINILH